MKYLTTAALLIGGAMLVSQSAFAQAITIVKNDLYLGFQNHGGTGSTADYVINLGASSNIIGQSTVVDLSSKISSTLFNSNALQGTSAQIMGGVVGASDAQNPSEVWGTQQRTSNFGNPAVAGSSAPGGLTTAQDTTVFQKLTATSWPTNGTGFLDTSKGWETYVEPSLTTSSFWGTAGFNPDSPVNTSTVLYEDLWWTSNGSSRGSQPFIYVGYFTLDLTGSTPSLTFTSLNVPASITPPVIVSVSKTGSTVTVVSSNAVPSHLYQLQYTASLNPTNWVDVGGSVSAGSALVTNTDTSAPGTNRFYRVLGQ